MPFPSRSHCVLIDVRRNQTMMLQNVHKDDDVAFLNGKV